MKYRSVAVKGQGLELTTKEQHREMFLKARLTAFYRDCGVSYKALQICQNSQSHASKKVNFHVCTFLRVRLKDLE